MPTTSLRSRKMVYALAWFGDYVQPKLHPVDVPGENVEDWARDEHDKEETTLVKQVLKILEAECEGADKVVIMSIKHIEVYDGTQ
jgi:hypothetical protein